MTKSVWLFQEYVIQIKGGRMGHSDMAVAP